MTAATLNLSVECGADYAQKITLKDDTGVAINITGYTFASMIKISAADDSPLLSFTCTPDANPALGTFTLSLTNAQTASLFAPGDGPSETMSLVYDIVQTVGSIKSRIIQGTITVYPGVTL
jgi:hypothetical protein